MKKVLILLLCLSSLLACNNAENKKGESLVHPTESSHHHHEATTLVLNNGAKWNSDENTNKNVNGLEVIMNRLNENKNKVLADYKTAGEELQTGLDKMISECRMKGPDHDALHQWLEPLLKNVSDAKKATSETEASNLFSEINERIKNYHQYFE